MLKSYCIFILFFAFTYLLNAQKVIYYSSSPVPNGVQTPKGSTINSGSSDEERDVQTRKSKDDELKNLFPSANINYDAAKDGVSSLNIYNCHGYAWIYTDYKISSQKLLRTLSSGSSQYADGYMEDGSYMEVTLLGVARRYAKRVAKSPRSLCLA